MLGASGGLLQPWWFLGLSSHPPCPHRARLRRLLPGADVQQHPARLQPGGVLLHCFRSVFPGCHRYGSVLSSPFFPPQEHLGDEQEQGEFLWAARRTALGCSRPKWSIQVFRLPSSISNFSHSCLVHLNVLFCLCG